MQCTYDNNERETQQSGTGTEPPDTTVTFVTKTESAEDVRV